MHARDSKLVHSVHGAVYIFPLAVISTLVTNMSTAIIRHFDAARAAISAERNCRAQGAAKLNARFAAVMGASVDSILGDSSASSLSASATGYQRLKEYLKAQGLDKAARIQVRLEVSKLVHESIDQAGKKLIAYVSDHLKLPAHESSHHSSSLEEALEGEEDAIGDDKSSGPISGCGHSSSVDRASDRTRSMEGATDAALDTLLESINDESVSAVLSANRKAAQEEYAQQTEFIENKAVELLFVSSSLNQVQTAVTLQKQTWLKDGKEPRSLYSDDQYKLLQAEKVAMEKDQSSHEADLQRYFDNASQGSSSMTNSLSKTDKVKLVLTTDLESGNSGFRQIQLVDLYCLSRGNEMWAIIPSIHRVGHDIDPVLCMHWKPIVDEMPESVKPFWVEQSRAFAKKLLALCSPSLRSKLLASHEHGTNKELFKVSESCGVSIYWTLVQLYHPIDRARRGSLQKEFVACVDKFKRGRGDPAIHIPELQVKHQEAMDIACRLNWDVCATPLIELLMSRDPLYTVRLEPFSVKSLEDPDDAATAIGDLITAIDVATRQLNNAEKAWDEPAGKALAATSETSKLQSELSKLKQAFAALNKKPQPHKNSGNNRQGPKGHCQVRGCDRKIVGWTSANNYKLCGTCLLKIKGDQKPLPLKDGTTFGKKAAIAQGIAFAAAKDKAKDKGKSTPYQQPPNPNSKRSKKRAAIAARAASSELEEGKGVALSSKKQKQVTLADEVVYYEG